MFKLTSFQTSNLLEFAEGIKILVDVGWDHSFDVATLREIEEYTSAISIVLLTHPTLDHLGAFAHCCKHVQGFNKIPVYATKPVIALGQTFLQDLYASNPLAATIVPANSLSQLGDHVLNASETLNILLQAPSSEEIKQYFSRINALEYAQPIQPLASAGFSHVDALEITAYNAGHSLGGTIWHIQHGRESVVHAVDWNQAKDNVFSGAAWFGTGGGGGQVIKELHRPTTLICSGEGMARASIAGGRKMRDDAILKLVHNTIVNGGTVLIPSDSSARILELAYLLEQHWRKEVNGNNADLYRDSRVYVASRSAVSTIRSASSMMDWMDEGTVREMEANNEKEQEQSNKKAEPDQTPLDFKHFKTLERTAQIDTVMSAGKPTVILASDSSLDWGLAREALSRLCEGPNNLLLLTDRIKRRDTAQTEHKSVAQLISDIWQQSAAHHGGVDSVASRAPLKPSGASVEYRDVQAVRLEGEETSYYQSYLMSQRQTQEIDPADMIPDEADDLNHLSEVSSESSWNTDEMAHGKSLNMTEYMVRNEHKKHRTDEELGPRILLRLNGIFDYDVRGKKGKMATFPYQEKKPAWNDDFGEVINPKDYSRAEEKEEKEEAVVEQKAKWYEESESEASDYEPEEPAPEGPVKAVFNTQSLTINAGIAYIDFSGLHDKRDLQMLIPLIRPRKLILVDSDATKAPSMVEECKALLGSENGANDVFAPAIGETVDASMDSNSWDLKLSDKLMRNLKWQDVGDLKVAAITGRLERVRVGPAQSDAIREKKLKLMDPEDKDDGHDGKENGTGAEKMEFVLNPAVSTGYGVNKPIYISDVRLADLRRLLQASGYAADFRGEGTLVVNNEVVVRKSGTGKIEVEGQGYMTGTFFEVRRMLYQALAVIGGQ